MKPEFYENFISKKLDPLAASLQEDFNWDALFERLGEPTDAEARDREMQLAAEFVRKVCHWVLSVELRQPDARRHVGERFAAFAWVTNPAFFEGAPSASQVAELLGIRRKANFWTLTGEVSRHFGITNRAQSHAWNRGLKGVGHRKRQRKYALPDLGDGGGKTAAKFS